MNKWDLYRAQLKWWWRHGMDRKLSQPKSPIAQWWTIETYGFGHENYKLRGIRFVRTKK